MGATQLSDVNYQSEVFRNMVADKYTHRLELYNSLFSEASEPGLENSTGLLGSISNLKVLSGDSDQITTSLSTTVNSTPTWKDTFAWIEREKAWGVDQVLRHIVGEDLTIGIAQFFAEYWASEVHASGIALLNGIYASALASTHVYDNSGDTINSIGLLGAKQLLGDNADSFTSITMNSKVHTDAVLAGLQVVTPSRDMVFSEGKIRTILGMTPYVTDKLTATANVYPTYLGTKGALVYKFRNRRQHTNSNAKVFDAGMIEVELYRDSTNGGGKDVLITRASFMVHCPGVQFDGTVASNPTNTELATSTAWTKTAPDDKMIPLVQYKSN